MMARRHGKRDAIHAHVRELLRGKGYLVWDLGDAGGGFPDLLVQDYVPGLEDEQGGLRLRLVEVKTGNEPLTPAQNRFIAEGWEVEIVRSVDDANRL